MFVCLTSIKYRERDHKINFDTPGAVSYRCSTVTEFVSSAVFEKMGPKHIEVATLTFRDHVTIRFAMCHFLVVHWNRASLSNRFPDIRPNTMLTIITNEPTNKQIRRITISPGRGI